MSDDRIDTEGRAPWRADVEKTLGKIHDRVTRIELRIGEALGIGDDDGRVGKELDAARADLKAVAMRVNAVAGDAKRANKAIATAVAIAIGGLGTAVQALRTSASEDGASLTRLSTLERDVDRLEQSIRSLWTATAPRTFRAPGDPP